MRNSASHLCSEKGNVLMILLKAVNALQEAEHFKFQRGQGHA